MLEAYGCVPAGIRTTKDTLGSLVRAKEKVAKAGRNPRDNQILTTLKAVGSTLVGIPPPPHEVDPLVVDFL